MISFTLKCEKGHSFDSWFQSAAAFEALAEAGHLTCAICGSDKVDKSLMAPRVAPKGRGRESAPKERDTERGSEQVPVPALGDPQSDMEKAVSELRRDVEQNSDYVGKDFVSQARAMHEGAAPVRSIYGEARLDQAKALVDDGVPVLPLPFRPKRSLS